MRELKKNMNRVEELNRSQSIDYSSSFYDCLNSGLLFNPKHGIDTQYSGHMSASIIIHHWNHAKFLPLLFKSFLAMDRTDIETQFIITDSGSDFDNTEKIFSLMKSYQNVLKIDFIQHDLDSLREKFNADNPDGTFHGFPYISNSALNYVKNDIHILCDSSNLVSSSWLRSLCSPHYVFHKSRLIIKSRGGDYTAESTLQFEDRENFFEQIDFKRPHTDYGFEAGRGFGWSIKTSEIKKMGGFNQELSCCGAVDDFTWSLAKKEGFQFLGHNQAKAIHRIHNEGYEKNPRKPNWGYKKLFELYQQDLIKNQNQEFVTPKLHLKNYDI